LYLFGDADGLENLTVTSQTQTKSGFLIVGTQGGVFYFNGVRFHRLILAQGLPEFGDVHFVRALGDGRLMIAMSDRLFVGCLPEKSAAPDHYRFTEIDRGEEGSLAWSQTGEWNGQFLIASRQGLFGWGLDSARFNLVHRRDLETLFGHSLITAMMVDGQTLWVGLQNGSVCRLFDGHSTCVRPANFNSEEPWEHIAVRRDGVVFVRSLHRLGQIDLTGRRIIFSALPYVKERYRFYQKFLCIAFDPDGNLVTQADAGLIKYQDGYWRPVELPASETAMTVISSILFDRNGVPWLGLFGRGEAHLLGHGYIENWRRQSGLSDDIVWNVARRRDGALWIGTDLGLDRLDPSASVIRPVAKGTTYSIAADNDGGIWFMSGMHAVRHMDMAGMAFDLPLNQVGYMAQGAGSDFWFFTQNGTFLSDLKKIRSFPDYVKEFPKSSGFGVMDTEQTMWTAERNRMIGRRRDGTIRVRVIPGLPHDFDPVAFGFSDARHAWIGGFGGLYRLTFDGDIVTDTSEIHMSDSTGGNLAGILVDRRGWLWVGTDQGLNVFNGKEWRSVRDQDGLVGNDIDQDSLFDDYDDTIWVGTTRGLSHIIDPAKVFVTHPLLPFLDRTLLGGKPIGDQRVAFSREPLFFTFGTLDYHDRSAIVFRYRLEGVDQGWATTSDDHVRYPLPPPGRHRFVLQIYNTQTHMTSDEISTVVDIGWPWWRSWAAYGGYAAGVGGLCYGVIRWRVRYLVRQRRELQSVIAQQTAELRQRAEELAYQASHDDLTGLLTRPAFQARLREDLAAVPEGRAVVLALFDVDHFKSVNDTYGHLSGDMVLSTLADRLKEHVMEGFAGRYGGEEFVVVIHTSEENSFSAMETLRCALTREMICLPKADLRVTLSGGMVVAGAHVPWNALIDQADQALYRAKRGGRDQLNVYDLIES